MPAAALADSVAISATHSRILLSASEQGSTEKPGFAVLWALKAAKCSCAARMAQACAAGATAARPGAPRPSPPEHLPLGASGVSAAMASKVSQCAESARTCSCMRRTSSRAAAMLPAASAPLAASRRLTRRCCGAKTFVSGRLCTSAVSVGALAACAATASGEAAAAGGAAAGAAAAGAAAGGGAAERSRTAGCATGSWTTGPPPLLVGLALRRLMAEGGRRAVCPEPHARGGEAPGLCMPSVPSGHIGGGEAVEAAAVIAANWLSKVAAVAWPALRASQLLLLALGVDAASAVATPRRGLGGTCMPCSLLASSAASKRFATPCWALAWALTAASAANSATRRKCTSSSLAGAGTRSESLDTRTGAGTGSESLGTSTDGCSGGGAVQAAAGKENCAGTGGSRKAGCASVRLSAGLDAGSFSEYAGPKALRRAAPTRSLASLAALLAIRVVL